MTRKVLTIGVIATVGLLVALSGAPNATAFHGSWWKGFGTAKLGPATVFNVEFLWGGQDAVIVCGGGGCQGSGDGRITFTDPVSLNAVAYPFVGVEDVRNVIFSEDATWCVSAGSLEITPVYSLTYQGGSLSGIQRNCLSTGINKNDFTGTFGPFALTIHAEGPFGVSHG
jgi:hypothetical protein